MLIVGTLPVKPRTYDNPPGGNAQPGLSVETNFGNGLTDDVLGTRLPSRLPVTGHGWPEPRDSRFLGVFFWGLGGLSILCSVLALLVRRRIAR